MCWIDAGSPGLDPDAGQVGMLMKPVMREHVAGKAGHWRWQNPAKSRKETDMTEQNVEQDAAMAAAIKRICRSKNDAALEDKRRGIREGELWAMRRASYRRLQVLEELADDYFNRGGRYDQDAGNDLAWAISLRLHSRYCEICTPAEVAADLFVHPGQRHSPTYITGFIRGASGVWMKVEQKTKS